MKRGEIVVDNRKWVDEHRSPFERYGDEQPVSWGDATLMADSCWEAEVAFPTDMRITVGIVDGYDGVRVDCQVNSPAGLPLQEFGGGTVTELAVAADRGDAVQILLGGGGEEPHCGNREGIHLGWSGGRGLRE
ncbi:hypothetical protein [Nocardia sp. XZ_19_369]|uniref:hypothetical protein n=1 Tax=Nocardia sp. XZ_19_369 TaxID=2769487 RepID=UPI00188F4DB4|nr:hypothetical protein [Nocardia sp. XZ_19_369]